MMVAKLYLCTMALLLSCVAVKADNPGVKAMVTKRGIDHANTVAQAALRSALSEVRLDDQGGSSGSVTWRIWNIQNRGVSQPASALRLDPAHNGLKWTVSNLGIDLKADWRVKYKKGWIKASTSGSVSLSLSRVTASVTLRLGVDASARPTVAVAACSANIGSLKLKFHGGFKAWLINRFKGSLEKRSRDKLTPQICRVIRKVVTERGNKQLQKLKVTTKLDGGKFTLDYGLTAPPKVTSDALDTRHKGVIYWTNGPRKAPPTSAPLPTPEAATLTDRMLHFWLGEMPANSWAKAAQDNGYLKYTVTAADLPANQASWLNASCPGLACIGALLPPLRDRFPGSVVRVDVTSLSAPALTLTPGAASLTARAALALLASSPNLTVPPSTVLRLEVQMTLALKASISPQDRLVAQILKLNFKLDNVTSDLMKPSESLVEGLEAAVNAGSKLVVIPKLNAMGQGGVALPLSDDVRLVRPRLAFTAGALVVSADVAYKQ